MHRRILNELLAARVQLKALNEKKAVLTQQVSGYSMGAADKQRKGYEYDRLFREVASKRDSLKLYKQKAEEARISDAMDEQKFSNAYILEKATLPLQKAGKPFMTAVNRRFNWRCGSGYRGRFRNRIFQSNS